MANHPARPMICCHRFVSTFYKFFSVIVFFIYILKVLCNQSDYDYGQLQHQLILIKELSVFGFTLQIDECRKINVYVKLQIAGLLCYSLLILARIGWDKYDAQRWRIRELGWKCLVCAAGIFYGIDHCDI